MACPILWLQAGNRNGAKCLSKVHLARLNDIDVINQGSLARTRANSPSPGHILPRPLAPKSNPPTPQLSGEFIFGMPAHG